MIGPPKGGRVCAVGLANDGLQTVYEDRTVPMGDLLNVQRLVLRNRLALNNAVAVADPEVSKANFKEMEENLAGIKQTWAGYMGTYLTPEEAALQANDLATVRQLLVTLDARLYGDVRKYIVSLTDLQLTVAKSEFNAAQSRYTTVRMLTIGPAVLGLAFALVFGPVLLRGIARALQASSV